MRKFKSLSVVFALFSVLMLTSCTNEGVDSDLLNPEAQDNGGNTGGNNGGNTGGNTGGNNGGNTDGSGTGSYWPMAINNKWSYDVTGGSPYTMKIISTESISGSIYYKLDNLMGASSNGGVGVNGTMWIKKQGGDYWGRIKASATTGADLSAIEYILVKDNVAVNSTWTQNLIQTVTYNIPGVPTIQMPITIEGKIIEKDITLQVGSQSFPNVIHSKITQSTMGTTTVGHYYFAKNVGPVKIELTGGGTNQTQLISSYVIN